MSRLRYISHLYTSELGALPSSEDTPLVIQAALPLRAQTAASPFDPPVPYGPGTGFPVLLDLAGIMRWFWQVREWQIAVNVTDVDAGESLSATTTLQNHGSNRTGTVVYPTDELQLPYAHGCDWDVVIAEGATVTLITWNADAIPAIPPRSLEPQVAWLEGHWYHAFQFGLGWNQTFTTRRSPASLPESGIDLNVDGVSVPLYMAVSEANQNFTGSVYITAKRYWAYARADGTEPVIDEGTGTMLRDFREG